MIWGTCAGCAAKDRENERLWALVESLRKENLNLVDLRAGNATFPRPPEHPGPPEKDPEPLPATSPARMRGVTFYPNLGPAELEKLYDIEETFEAGGSS